MRRLKGRPATRYYFVPQDGTLFLVSGSWGKERFNDLRKKTPNMTFKSVPICWVRPIRRLGSVTQEIELNLTIE